MSLLDLPIEILIYILELTNEVDYKTITTLYKNIEYIFPVKPASICLSCKKLYIAGLQVYAVSDNSNTYLKFNNPIITSLEDAKSNLIKINCKLSSINKQHMSTAITRKCNAYDISQKHVYLTACLNFIKHETFNLFSYKYNKLTHLTISNEFDVPETSITRVRFPCLKVLNISATIYNHKIRTLIYNHKDTLLTIGILLLGNLSTICYDILDIMKFCLKLIEYNLTLKDVTVTKKCNYNITEMLSLSGNQARVRKIKKSKCRTNLCIPIFGHITVDYNSIYNELNKILPTVNSIHREPNIITQNIEVYTSIPLKSNIESNNRLTYIEDYFILTDIPNDVLLITTNFRYLTSLHLLNLKAEFWPSLPKDTFVNITSISFTHYNVCKFWKCSHWYCDNIITDIHLCQIISLFPNIKNIHIKGYLISNFKTHKNLLLQYITDKTVVYIGEKIGIYIGKYATYTQFIDAVHKRMDYMCYNPRLLLSIIKLIWNFNAFSVSSVEINDTLFSSEIDQPSIDIFSDYIFSQLYNSHWLLDICVYKKIKLPSNIYCLTLDIELIDFKWFMSLLSALPYLHIITLSSLSILSNIEYDIDKCVFKYLCEFNCTPSYIELFRKFLFNFNGKSIIFNSIL